MDENEFFRQATLRICGNLGIEKGLQECFNYLVDFMPADNLYLERYERDMTAVNIIAHANERGASKLNLFIPLDNEAKKKMNSLAVEGYPSLYVSNKPAEDPITSSILSTLKQPLSSVMSLMLKVEGKVLGALTLLAEGDGRFKEHHMKLYSTLNEPYFVAMSNALEHREVLKLKDLLADDNRYLQGELLKRSGDEIVGANFGLQDTMRRVRQVASLDSPVLLMGETGSGKDVLANFIHSSSTREGGPFVSVNCGAIPDTLIDSELFGHEKGAFTGALSRKRGRFERAHNGTIFLDEIAELPFQAQARLLRVLQQKEIERVGGVDTISLNIRVIAATNRNLEEMVKDGEFREDLWFRLNVFPIMVPPLRERIIDLPALIQHFIGVKAKELKLSSIPSIAPGAMEPLMHYHWPGNVRELQNVIERALILDPSGPLSFGYLDTNTSRENISSDPRPLDSYNLDEVISNHINRVLAITNGKVNGDDGAAALLGVNSSTLRNRMKKLGIRFGRKTE